jgi:hypothetical protein
MIMCCLVRAVANLRVGSVWSSGVMILCKENLKKPGEKSISELLQTPKGHIMFSATELSLYGEKPELWLLWDLF